MAEQPTERELRLSPEDFELPAKVDGPLHAAALELDRTFQIGHLGDDLSPEAMTVLTEYDKALNEHLAALGLREPVLLVEWPTSWYLPGDADYSSYWWHEPPSDHRYFDDWKNSDSNTASKATGTLHANNQLRPQDRHTSSEAGLGVLYSPPFTYGVITLRPTVSCRGEHRWLQEYNDDIVAGTTHTVHSLHLAMWQWIDARWVLVAPGRSVLVEDGYEHEGLGQEMINSFARDFTGADLAASFVVRGDCQYVLGVVARVQIWSTLTKSNGDLLPPYLDPDLFKIYGHLRCEVPRINVNVRHVIVK
jgi:hypothetical protein